MTESDERFDPHIDAAARQMTAGEPSPEFAGRVITRLEAPAPRAGVGWRLTAVGVTAGVALTILVARRPPPPAAEPASAVVSNASAAVGPSATVPPAADSLVRGPVAARVEPSALPALDPIPIAPIALGLIELGETAVARVEIAPLIVTLLEVTPVEEQQ